MTENCNHPNYDDKERVGLHKSDMRLVGAIAAGELEGASDKILSSSPLLSKEW